MVAISSIYSTFDSRLPRICGDCTKQSPDTQAYIRVIYSDKTFANHKFKRLHATECTCVYRLLLLWTRNRHDSSWGAYLHAWAAYVSGNRRMLQPCPDL